MNKRNAIHLAMPSINNADAIKNVVGESSIPGKKDADAEAADFKSTNNIYSPSTKILMELNT
jgi:hypothetical protein